MQRALRRLASLAIFCLLVSTAAAQQEVDLPKPVGRGKAHYVSEAGNDAADGSQARPWRSLTRANSSVKPGDVVYVLPGHYEGAALKAAGTKSLPITYVSVERHKAIIDLGGFQGTKGTHGHRVQVDGAYTIFDGFACSTGWDPAVGNDRKAKNPGAPGAGIASYRSRGVVLRNNDCYDNEKWAIFTKQVTDLVVENNTLRHTRREHGIYLADGATDCILRNNASYENGGCGIQLNQGSVDPYVNVAIEGNLLYDNNHSAGQSINLDGGTDVTIRNNVLVVNRRNGIALYKGDGAEPARDNVIVNNLFLLEQGSRGGILTADCGTNWIFNNIFWSVARTPAFNDEGSTLQKQHVGFNAGNVRLPGENNVTLSGKLGDLFENPSERLFKLKSNVPMIDRGAATFQGKSAPVTDRDGVKRPSGAGIDIGPYEAPAE